jgi:hypothetical protein
MIAHDHVVCSDAERKEQQVSGCALSNAHAAQHCVQKEAAGMFASPLAIDALSANVQKVQQDSVNTTIIHEDGAL